MKLDREAFEMGYDEGYLNRIPMDWKEFTGGNPGYNRSWGSYQRGIEKGKADRQTAREEA